MMFLSSVNVAKENIVSQVTHLSAMRSGWNVHCDK